jgi:hypothetical protein
MLGQSPLKNSSQAGIRFTTGERLLWAESALPRAKGGMRTLALGHIDGHSKKNFVQAMLRVIPPFLTGCGRRVYAAILSFWAGVMPPMPMFGRSLL